MSLESVRAFFAEKAPDITVIVSPISSATVALAAEAYGVEPARIGKTLSLRVGERVAYVWPSSGAYTEVRNVPAERVVKVPRGISDEQAAALMLKGLTAQFLIRRTYRVARGDTMAVIGCGGVGLNAIQAGDCRSGHGHRHRHQLNEARSRVVASPAVSEPTWRSTSSALPARPGACSP